jgi:pre-rRNA-processing protein TSR4
MRLLIQLHGDLPEQFPGHKRWLYVFMCPKKTCRRKLGCARVIRGHRADDRDQSPAQQDTSKHNILQETSSPINVGAALFGNSTSVQSTNPFATKWSGQSNPFASAPSSASNPFSSLSDLAAKPAQKPASGMSTLPETFASKARISAQSAGPLIARPHEPWPESSRLSSPYPTFYLEAEYETLSEYPKPEPRLQATLDLGEDSSGGKAEDKELFESAMDKTFQKFADTVEQNPDQALRYEFAGWPLLYSSTDAVGKLLSGNAKAGSRVHTIAARSGIPTCPNCSQPRTFEAQLMPHAITVLEKDEMSIDGMDWGTIIIGVCSKNCFPRDITAGEVGYLEEWAGIQWEEVDSKK